MDFHETFTEYICHGMVMHVVLYQGSSVIEELLLFVCLTVNDFICPQPFVTNG